MPNIDQAIAMMRNRLGRNVPGVEPPQTVMTDDMGPMPGAGMGELPPASVPMAGPRGVRQDLSGAQNGTIMGQHGGTQQLGRAALSRLPPAGGGGLGGSPPSGPIMDPRERMVSPGGDGSMAYAGGPAGGGPGMGWTPPGLPGLPINSMPVNLDPSGGMRYDLPPGAGGGDGMLDTGHGLGIGVGGPGDFGPPQPGAEQPFLTNSISTNQPQPSQPFTTDIATARVRPQVRPAVGVGGVGGPTGGATKPGAPAPTLSTMGGTGGTAVSKPAVMPPSMPSIDNKLRRSPVRGGGAMQRRKQVNRRMGGVLERYGGLK